MGNADYEIERLESLLARTAKRVGELEHEITELKQRMRPLERFWIAVAPRVRKYLPMI